MTRLALRTVQEPCLLQVFPPSLFLQVKHDSSCLELIRNYASLLTYNERCPLSTTLW